MSTNTARIEEQNPEPIQENTITSVSTEQLQQIFYISRHLRSCNNVVDDKSPMFGVLKKQGEPALSLWGALTGLGLKRDLLGDFRGKVYVSCLVRTWMTAILQYLPFCEKQKITLVVSPFIKEKHLASFDYGNLPIILNKQIKKLQQFFDFLLLIKLSLLTQTSNSELYNNILSNLTQILSPNLEINIIFPFENKTINLIYLNNKLVLNTVINDISVKKAIKYITLDKNFITVKPTLPYEECPNLAYVTEDGTKNTKLLGVIYK